MQDSFRPACDLETWKARLRLTSAVRDFFNSRGVLEVETPAMSRAEGTDPQLDYFETKGTPARYLMTSPEFHLKRLLSAGFGDVFEIAKAFRVDEIGARHNSEFSLVEWYRVGMPMEMLMMEVEDLCTQILGREVKAKRTRWKDAFLNYAGIDPFEKPGEVWRKCCEAHGVPDVQCSEKFSQEDWWDYLMVTVVEPHLGSSGPEFLMDYPVSQAALAQTFTGDDGRVWARRFELYIETMELCNGYQELTDAAEQERRFGKDIELRAAMGKPLPAADKRFLAALRAGMPAASGVALGLDRLFMLALRKKNIRDVMLFPDDIS
jgi:elongation factor P--(R)-beta-lysine ligase